MKAISKRQRGRAHGRADAPFWQNAGSHLVCFRVEIQKSILKSLRGVRMALMRHTACYTESGCLSSSAIGVTPWIQSRDWPSQGKEPITLEKWWDQPVRWTPCWGGWPLKGQVAPQSPHSVLYLWSRRGTFQVINTVATETRAAQTRGN